MTRILELRIEELLDRHRKDVVETADRLLHSGLIDPESYHGGEFRLAKVLLTAALRETVNTFAPPPSFKKERADINNLKHV